MSSTTTDVLIVGAGPTGLTLATALATRSIQTTVIDREAAGANSSRAAVVHARTLEVLESIGVTGRLLKLGIHAPQFTMRDRDRILVPVRFDNLPTQYPYTLMMSQAVTEAVLRDRYAERGGQVLWRRALTDLTQNDQDVIATLDDGTRLHTRYLVGTDGMHSNQWC
jgi:2-polyprenyl-6-methoxyphenol hydroxylase-like FAD-dependent oxidoreductase